jgi:DNA primase
MGGRIGDETIREVRERASLIDVISEAVALKRRGRTALGLCPFHAEKTPSFNVSEERGFYHCFGCGEHGDVIDFVMKTQGLAFPEAVRVVAARVGVDVPEEDGSAPRKPTEPLVAVSAAAAAFFQGMLRSPRGARARAYLTERGITDATIERFRLGYAPADGDALARHLKAQGLRLEDALEVGLIARRDGGGVYDRFRERVMFPIADTSGRPVAFSGRVLPGAPVTGNPPPKYLNSPESPVFHKGRMLYGLDLARSAIRARGRVLIVEGNVDVVGVAQAGIEEVVAPLGTALTVDQLRVLRRFTDRIIACFDGDDAGRHAAARSFPLFVEAGLWGLGVFLPAGEDPDTFVRSAGAEKLAAEVERAVPLVDAFVRDLAGTDRTATSRHADAAREVVRLLQKIDDPYAREPLVRLAAHYLGMRPETLLAEGTPRRAVAAPAVRPAEAPSAEELLVELMASDAGAATTVRDAQVIEVFESPDWRRLAEVLAETSNDEDRNEIVQQLPRTLRDRVVHRLLGDVADEEDRERVLADCIAAIRRRHGRRARNELRDALRAAEQRGDAAGVAAAQEAFQRALADKDRT